MKGGVSLYIRGEPYRHPSRLAEAGSHLRMTTEDVAVILRCAHLRASKDDGEGEVSHPSLNPYSGTLPVAP
jgi:hypothetical protein